MANHKSAEKAHNISKKKAVRNKSIENRCKTFIKKVESSIISGSYTDARVALSNADSQIMKAVSKGVFKLNTASRKVSNLAKRVKALENTKTA